MSQVRKDERFSAVLNDRRFKAVPLKDRKIKIGKRFQPMFKEKHFKLNYALDKRGRPITKTSTEDLKKYYTSSESEEDNDKNDANIKEVSSKQQSVQELDDDSSNDVSKTKKLEKEKDDILDDTDADSIHSEEVEETDSSTSEEGSESTSDEDTDSSEDDLEDDEFDHQWEEFDRNAPVADEITKRLALCNMDWDRIRAEDILTVFNSFKPADSIIHSIKIYPSEYGRLRMEEEKLKGPRELVEQTLDGDEVGQQDSSKDGSRYHREKLRQYQINRLKYYYAVIDCDRPETANALYEHLNGMEYESSAISMDLRFIPDDVLFDEEPSSTAQTVLDPAEYKPRLFVNSALQQVKVNLTWDETDPKRRETLQKAFHEPESIEKDLRAYLASSSGSDSENDGNIQDGREKRSMAELIASYKALVQPLEDKEKEEHKYDMEITWEPGLKDKTEEIIEKKMQQNLTPFEKKLKDDKEKKKQKKKEKRQETKEARSDNEECSDSDNDITKNRKKQNTFKSRKGTDEKDSQMVDELKLLVGDTKQSSESNSVEMSVKSKKSKARKVNKKKESKMEEPDVDIDDPRFADIYSSHLYNIDPTDPHFKNTKGMMSIIERKQKKRQNTSSDVSKQIAQKKNKMSEESMKLVNSVKRKTAFQWKNK